MKWCCIPRAEYQHICGSPVLLSRLADGSRSVPKAGKMWLKINFFDPADSTRFTDDWFITVRFERLRTHDSTAVKRTWRRTGRRDRQNRPDGALKTSATSGGRSICAEQPTRHTTTWPVCCDTSFSAFPGDRVDHLVHCRLFFRPTNWCRINRSARMDGPTPGAPRGWRLPTGSTTTLRGTCASSWLYRYVANVGEDVAMPVGDGKNHDVVVLLRTSKSIKSVVRWHVTTNGPQFFFFFNTVLLASYTVE